MLKDSPPTAQINPAKKKKNRKITASNADKKPFLFTAMP